LPCRYFVKGFCQRAGRCPFAHDVGQRGRPGATAGAGEPRPAGTGGKKVKVVAPVVVAPRPAEQPKPGAAFKTKRCHHDRKGRCQFGDKCTFLHASDMAAGLPRGGSAASSAPDDPPSRGGSFPSPDYVMRGGAPAAPAAPATPAAPAAGFIMYGGDAFGAQPAAVPASQHVNPLRAGMLGARSGAGGGAGAGPRPAPAVSLAAAEQLVSRASAPAGVAGQDQGAGAEMLQLQAFFEQLASSGQLEHMSAALQGRAPEGSPSGPVGGEPAPPKPDTPDTPVYQAASGEADCVVCMGRAREVAFLPCGHRMACRDCAHVWKRERGACVACGQAIQRVSDDRGWLSEDPWRSMQPGLRG